MKADPVPAASAASSASSPTWTEARTPDARDEDSAPPVVHEVISSPGQPLDPSARSFMERRFEVDFGSVRVHRDSRAAESAASVDALAYTVGEHVVFGSGSYRPETPHGRWLIAHELSHVSQQRAAASDAAFPQRLAIGRSDTPSEHAADRTADAVLLAGPGLRHNLAPVPVPTLQRIGEGHAFLRFFGIESGEFTPEDLTAYLTKIARQRKLSDGFLDDDMARAIVDRGGVGGEGGYRLTDASFQDVSSTDIKRILVQEMLSGPTDAPDEQAIVRLFAQSTGSQIQQILDPQLGLSIRDVEGDLGDDAIAQLYEAIDAKLPDLRKGNLKRGKGTATTDGSCTAGRALLIDFAHRRAIVQVERVIRMIDQFTTQPDENKNVGRVLGIYFKGATPSVIQTIRQNFVEIRTTIDKLQYVCPAEPFTGFKVTDSQGKVKTFEPEPGVEAIALTQTTGNDMKVLLFPDFFAEDAQPQARVVVHEAFHHAKRQGDIPEFYASDTEGLELATALTNADSYGQAARALAQEGLQVTLTDCPPHVHGMILTATRQAEIRVARAVSALAGTITDPGVISQLKRHFKVDLAAQKNVEHLARVREVFDEMQAGFGTEIPIECEEECGEDDRTATAAYTGGIFSPRGGTIHLCPAWVRAEPDDQTHTLVHEMAHRTAGLGFTNDIYRKADLAAYNSSKVEQAVSNADAYASFALSISAAVARSTAGGPQQSGTP